jgi:predicted CopG family antitoxin
MIKNAFIRKLPNGKYRVVSHKGKNLGTFDSRAKAKKHLSEIEFFKHKGKQKRKASFVAIISKLANEKETTDTFSSAIRELRKKSPEKVKAFLKSFKEAFDNAVDDDIDNAENAALLEAKMKNK